MNDFNTIFINAKTDGILNTNKNIEINENSKEIYILNSISRKFLHGSNRHRDEDRCCFVSTTKQDYIIDTIEELAPVLGDSVIKSILVSMSYDLSAIDTTNLKEEFFEIFHSDPQEMKNFIEIETDFKIVYYEFSKRPIGVFINEKEIDDFILENSKYFKNGSIEKQSMLISYGELYHKIKK